MEISEKLTKLLSSKKRKSSGYSEETNSKRLDRSLATSCRQFFSSKVEFHLVESGDSHLDYLKSRYKPLNRLSPPSKLVMDRDSNDGTQSNPGGSQGNIEDIPKPKKELFDSKNVVLEWKSVRGVGSGLTNLGNTCFLNSVLQCLLYTPPLHNYLTSAEHKESCLAQGLCMMCVFQKHCNMVLNSNHGTVKPVSIVQNLRAIAKPFRQGRQEDAHEFLRYFVDALQKSCLQGLPSNLDPHSKATTVVHKIFGGYHRSQVKCLECMKTSNTFDPLLDINLDIKNCPTLSKALQRSIQSDTLEGDNCYACPFCKKMTRAQKRFTIHRLPSILTIQLKRFEYNGLFGGKINKHVNFPENINMRPYMSVPKGPSEWYRLYAVLVHFGYSSHSGHYFCYIKNSNNIWYCMNDSHVSQVSLTTVLSQEAYLLFYVKDNKYKPAGNQGSAASSAHNSKTSGSSASSSHLPPRANNGNNKTGKIKPDPNFLGTAMKRPGVLPRLPAALDKTGTPLVKLNAPKPTGIVNPSPHSSTPRPLPENPAVPSSPKVPKPPTTIKLPPIENPPHFPPLDMPAGKANSPTDQKPAREATEGVAQTPKGEALESKKKTPPETIREFSIPLRKTPIGNLFSEKPPSISREHVRPAPPPPKPPSPVKVPEKKPFFTPRQIAAPLKTKKPLKPKRLGEAAVPKRVVLEETTRSILPAKSISAQSEETRVSNSPGPVAAGGIAKGVEEEDDDESKPPTAPPAAPQPGFKALMDHGPVSQLPPGPTVLPALPPPSSPPRLGSLRMAPFTLKQKVAHVSPLPPLVGTKPIARVKPNLHLSPPDAHSRAAAITPSTPHAYGTSLWTVTPRSEESEEDGNRHASHQTRDDERTRSPAHHSSRDRGGGDHSHSKHRHHRKKHHKKSHHRHSSEYGERRSTHKWRESSRDEGRRRGHHAYHSDSTNDVSAASSSDSEGYGRGYRDKRPSHSGSGRRRHSSGHKHHHHSKHRSPSSHWSSEERRRERKRPSSEFRRHESERSVSPDERRHKKAKSEHFVSSAGGKKGKLDSVAEVEWDSGGQAKSCSDTLGWDGTKSTSTVEQLTRHSLDKLVRSWDGGENSIDASCTSGGREKGIRDTWDQQLDRGKVKDGKKKAKSEFASDKNFFQEQQNKRNKGESRF